MANRYSSNPYARRDVRVRQVPTLSGALWQGIRNYSPQRYPRATGLLCLWLFGLFAVFLSPAPVKITAESFARYDQLVQQAQGDHKVRQVAEQRLWETAMYTEEAKVWFWRFRSPHNEIVRERSKHQSEAQAVVTKLNKQRAAIMSEAKSQLGLWSDAGIEEARASFWKSFEAGKVFGRRQTLWDAILTVLGDRERNAMGLLLKVLFSALVNFTIGMVSSIFVFTFKLPWLLADYKPGWISGLSFFMVALTAAISVVTGFLAAMYGTSAAGVYAAVTLMNSSSRLQDQQYRRGGNIRYHHD